MYFYTPAIDEGQKKQIINIFLEWDWKDVILIIHVRYCTQFEALFFYSLWQDHQLLDIICHRCLPCGQMHFLKQLRSLNRRRAGVMHTLGMWHWNVVQELCAVSSYLMTTFKVLVAIGQSEFVFGLFNFLLSFRY